MELDYVPLLQVQRDLHDIPRGSGRFKHYLRTIFQQDELGMRVPLLAMNPMGKDHVTALLDDFLALDADLSGEQAAAEVSTQLAEVPGEFKTALVVADDLMGGWTNHDMVLGRRVEEAFAIHREPDRIRDSYGRTSVGEKALLARRLVEAGTTFVMVSGAWGYFDHHGDNVPPWGGIQKGLTPILPTIDRALHTLIQDLEARGLLDSTLILMMGEFGRSPVMTTDGGRNHWTNVMSMVLAGGGLRHGRVIGGTDPRGGEIRDRRVKPSDLAATVFRHLNIPLDSHWVNPQGRPIPIVTDEGQPIAELF